MRNVTDDDSIIKLDKVITVNAIRYFYSSNILVFWISANPISPNKLKTRPMTKIRLSLYFWQNAFTKIIMKKAKIAIKI
jgi:hypothetical protein